MHLSAQQDLACNAATVQCQQRCGVAVRVFGGAERMMVEHAHCADRFMHGVQFQQRYTIMLMNLDGQVH